MKQLLLLLALCTSHLFSSSPKSIINVSDDSISISQFDLSKSEGLRVDSATEVVMSLSKWYSRFSKDTISRADKRFLSMLKPEVSISACESSSFAVLYHTVLKGLVLHSSHDIYLNNAPFRQGNGSDTDSTSIKLTITGKTFVHFKERKLRRHIQRSDASIFKLEISNESGSITVGSIVNYLNLLPKDSLVLTTTCNGDSTIALNYLIERKRRELDTRVIKAYKPIIYLYPQKPTTIAVKLDSSIDLTFTYPAYADSGWRVLADSSGKLKDLSTGRSYYSLFWEGYDSYQCDFSEGFVVSRSEVILFLEEKLSKLGLNYRERQEFIIFWAPLLEQNEFSAVHFATEEYNRAVPITIEPKPETLVRIMMSFKKVDKSWIEPGNFDTSVDGQRGINEQYLAPLERSGFTVIEWGGKEYPSSDQ